MPDVRRRFSNIKKLVKVKFFTVIRKELKRISVFKTVKNINVKSAVRLSGWMKAEE